MFKVLRTVAEALGRAGLKVMSTNGVRADWLFCGCGFKASSSALRPVCLL